MKQKNILFIALFFGILLSTRAQLWQHVDPRIGIVGVGRTFPGPSMPFGMVKPGPDCGVLPNAGWAPMPQPVSGFSQTHVSGTGGGQKYGNVLILPYIGEPTEQLRSSEEIALGYYATTFQSGIRTEITTAERCAYYRLHYPRPGGGLLVDATHFLGKSDTPDLRERQQFVGAEVEKVSPQEVRGFTRIRGGWNNGDAYTVYFCLLADKPFRLSEETYENPSEKAASTPRTGKHLLMISDTLVNIKVGISYVSTQQARRNIPETDFDTQLNLLRQCWEQQLSCIQIEGTPAQRRMFYTALYHTLLMPVDKAGENPKWTDTPYYDDYYAIWDTYRTSTPLITLLDPQREADIVNSLLNIYRRDGYMPDARSGDCNGRTQGGSNADVVIADAFVKGLPGIDFELALKALLKDGEADPGSDHEKHGRGGLNEYVRLGYIPYGIPRAGTRTIEYAYNDFCVAQVAKGLGHLDVYEEYMRRSGNWRNLWRADYDWDDVNGYIMPRDATGQWLDSVPWGRSKVFHPQIPYTPVTKVAPWYLPWWDTFFYEALSAEYSLSIPHDVPGLIEICGGQEAFRRRLDLFFQRGRYNVGNEPSFLTPCLYHWIGRPDLSTQRIHQIINDNYSDQPDGLPGNDDSGAMSSWLAFHMMGIYPNAGQDYYLLNLPLLHEYTFLLANGRSLHVTKKGKGDSFRSVSFNDTLLPDARITHDLLMQGGELVFKTEVPTAPTASPLPSPKGGGEWESATPASFGGGREKALEASVSFTLNRQFRTWPVSFTWQDDTLLVSCKQTLYKIPRNEAEHATGFCWLTPQDDGTIYDHVRGTFLFVSSDAVNQLEQQGFFVYNGITWRRIGQNHLRADIDGTELWLTQQDGLWIVSEMRNNPLGIDWVIY